MEKTREAALARAASKFGPFDGRAWLNTAHQGPLPRPAVDASLHAAALKAAPHRIADADFSAVPERLRATLGQLVGSPADQIILGNSTSHGLHLIANGLSWGEGDEVLVIEGDYPATALGAVCRRAGVLLVVNASQALGARPVDVQATPVDAVVACGYKWLCGPYGTGSPGCIQDSSSACDRSRPTGWPCKPGAGWITCAIPPSATTSACAPSMSSARPASRPRCRGSPPWKSCWRPASLRSLTAISSSLTA